MTAQRNSNLLRYMLGFIGVLQIFFGILFTFLPNTFAGFVGLEAAPPWALWMFTMFGARAFGFAYGMFLALRDPVRHTSWIVAMIGVQAIDWLGTMVYLLNGSLTLTQVSTAAVLPILFIGTLVMRFPRQRVAAAG